MDSVCGGKLRVSKVSLRTSAMMVLILSVPRERKHCVIATCCNSISRLEEACRHSSLRACIERLREMSSSGGIC